jgi:signal transduction histidine kinase/DNA-binding response OmpR family regulator
MSAADDNDLNTVENLAKFPDENPNPVMRVGGEAQVIYANQPADLILSAWQIGRKETLPGELAAKVKQALESNTGFWHEVSTGDLIYGLDFAPIPEHGYLNVYGRNITRQRKLEEELIRARDVALAANRAKSGFLANMSHELRTPMNAIIGYSEMLVEDAAEMGLTDMVPDLRKIHRAGRHLLDLINDILDLSKIEAGRMDIFLETVTVASLLEQVLDTARPLLDQKNNQFELNIADSVATIHTDVTKVRQMLLNLLSNAAKFTDGGTISLSVATEGEMVCFTLKDTGIGMSAEQANRIFDSFAQADASTTRKFGGTGLGLTITKRFAEMLGGAIEVSSEENEGTMFRITLPMQTKERRSSSPEASRPPSHISSRSEGDSAGTVLVIDDDPAVLDVVSSTLAKAGFDVTTASNGEDGMRLARELQPVAITLDIIMPGLDGWHVLTQLKADPETRDIPVVLVTMSQDRSLGLALGATDFVTKPVDRQHLVELIAGYCGADPNPEVLIVEDDADLRSLLARTFAKQGWASREANNGQVALDMMTDRLPQAVLLDLMMPVMDGFQFLATVKADERFKDVPIIVVTAKELDDEDRKRLNGYVAQVLQKGSYTREELLREIRKLVTGAVGSLAAAMPAEAD